MRTTEEPTYLQICYLPATMLRVGYRQFWKTPQEVDRLNLKPVELDHLSFAYAWRL